VPLGMHQGTSKVKRRSLLISAVVAAVVGVAVLGGSVALGSNSSPSAIKVGEWPLPGADLQNTRMVPGPITSANVGTLKVAWKVPIRSVGSFGDYATTPIVVGGIVYTQDINSNVYAIDLKTGKVNWFKKYNKPDEGPNGVNVVDGVVYGATGDSAFALQASTGEQIWIKKLTRNANEGVDMAPGYNDGTVYVSTVPGNAKGFYKGNGQAILWAMDAKTGATKWKWAEVPVDLWSKAHTNINSGGGQWDPPSFDANGDVFVTVSNPAPFPGTKEAPYGSSRPSANLYSDSIVKLNKDTGKLEWYYQLTPHDINGGVWEAGHLRDGGAS
jgi:glucose dehydrogenase